MYFLTTHNSELDETKTRHFATHRALLDAAKEFIRTTLNDDDAFDELIQAHIAEAATWEDYNDELQALFEKFEEQMSGNCPTLVWGEVEMPITATHTDHAAWLLRTLGRMEPTHDADDAIFTLNRLIGEAHRLEAAPGTHEIHRLLTVSTAHVPEAMLDRLADADSPLPMLATDEYGAWLRTGLSKPVDEVPEEDAWTTKEWGAELTTVLAYARNLGCAYVRLDCDGPEYTALPTYRHR